MDPLLNLNQKTIVVILGGGRGTRLYPLTKFRSKPAVPFAGKYRLIDIPISNCLHSGIDRIYVLTQFHSASLNRHISRTYNFDSFTRGFVEVLAAEQTIVSNEWFQGTADAVRKIYPHLMNQTWDQVLILSGDHLYRMDYRPYLKYHLKKKAEMTVCTLGVDEDAAGDLGILKANKSGRITAFKEKPGAGQVDDMRLDTTSKGSFMEGFSKPLLASMGIYIVNREVLKSILFDNPLLNDFGKQIIPDNLKKRKVYAYPFDEYWEDIGGIRSFFEANLNLCKDNPPFQLIHHTQPIYTHHRHLSGAAVIESKVTNCIINDGSMIRKAELKDSVIGLRSYIEEGGYVEKSLIFGADYYAGEECAQGRSPGIGKNTRIIGAILEKNVHIGKNVVIENKKGVTEYDDPEGRYYIREGIVIVVKNASIPDNTVI